MYLSFGGIRVSVRCILKYVVGGRWYTSLPEGFFKELFVKVLDMHSSNLSPIRPSAPPFPHSVSSVAVDQGQSDHRDDPAP